MGKWLMRIGPMAVRTSLRTITQDYSPLVTGVSIRDGAFGRVTGHFHEKAGRCQQIFWPGIDESEG